MNDEVYILFNRLKDLTNEALEAVESEDYDKLDFIMAERKKTIDCIASLNCTKEELKSLYDDLNIHEIETKLSQSINSKEVEIKARLSKISLTGSTINNYYAQFNKKAVFFSKKV